MAKKSQPKTETANERNARLQRALVGVQKVLDTERAFIMVASLQILPDGRVSPEVRIQVNP